MPKRSKTMAITACMKTLLILFNFIFWLFGIQLMCIVILMPISFVDHIAVNTVNSKAGLLTLLSLGAILALISSFACCCTTRGHPALLYLYGAFLAVVGLLVLGAGALIYACWPNINEKFDQKLNEMMTAYGQNDRKTSDMDFTQSTLECCGNKGYTDWLNMQPPKEIPRSCCKASKDTCDVSYVNDIYTQGCYTVVWDFINCNIDKIVGVAICIGLFPLVGVLLACCLAGNINRLRYKQIAYNLHLSQKNIPHH